MQYYVFGCLGGHMKTEFLFSFLLFGEIKRALTRDTWKRHQRENKLPLKPNIVIFTPTLSKHVPTE